MLGQYPLASVPLADLLATGAPPIPSVVPFRRRIERNKMLVTGKYNQAKTLYFSLFQPDGINFEPAATFAAGDVTLMSDEGVEVNTTNLPVDEGQGYSLTLTAAEMSAARLKIYLVDQDATKVWLDTDITVETYGNTLAEHEYDLDTPNTVADPNPNLPTELGTVNDATPTTSSFITTFTGVDNDHYKDDLVVVGMGGGKFQARTIEASNGTTGLFTLVHPLTSAPANGAFLGVQVTHLYSIAEINEALVTTARPQPGQGTPAPSQSMAAKIDDLHKRAINRMDTDGTTEQYYNAAGTVVDHKRTNSELAGVTTKGTVVTGP